MQNFPIEMQKGSLRLMFFFVVVRCCCTKLLLTFQCSEDEFCVCSVMCEQSTYNFFSIPSSTAFCFVHRTCFTNNGFKINFRFSFVGSCWQWYIKNLKGNICLCLSNNFRSNMGSKIRGCLSFRSINKKIFENNCKTIRVITTFQAKIGYRKNTFKFLKVLKKCLKNPKNSYGVLQQFLGFFFNKFKGYLPFENSFGDYFLMFNSF